MTAFEVERRGVTLPPPREDSAHDRLAVVFARDLGKGEDNMPARVMAEVVAGRFEKLVGRLPDAQERENFLNNRPRIDDLNVRVVNKSGALVPAGFGKEQLSVKLPGLENYGDDLRAEIMYEYARFRLLLAFSDDKSGESKQRRDELFEVLSDLNLDRTRIEETGEYARSYQSSIGPDRKKRAAILEKDSELFADIMLAMAAKDASAGQNLRQIWNKILRGNVSMASTQELGGPIMLTDDDLPYRIEKMPDDIREAKRRIGVASALKTKDVVERESASALSATPAQNEISLEERHKLDRKTEVFRRCIKSSLGRIGVFQKSVGEVNSEKPEEVVDLVELIFFDEFGVLFEKVLKDDLHVSDPMFEKVKDERDFGKFQTVLENAVKTIIRLKAKIDKVRQAKTEQGKISAAKDLKAAARAALVSLRVSFSQVDGEIIDVKKKT